MKCPYDPKINACVYLDEMTQDNRTYECPDCPHYHPHSYYDDPERESSAILAIVICGGVSAIMLFLYLALKLFEIIKAWLS